MIIMIYTKGIKRKIIKLINMKEKCVKEWKERIGSQANENKNKIETKKMNQCRQLVEKLINCKK